MLRCEWQAMAASSISTTLSGNGSVQLYFGNGCFFARQNLFIDQFEQKVLGRKNDQLTSIAGYAGSTRIGPDGSACYHNPQNFSDYGALGHAEVVELHVPIDSLAHAFSIYFGSFIEVDTGTWARPDYYDQGAEYRSLVGVPGGFANSKVLKAMRDANVHNLTLQVGRGSDPDTFSTNTVFVMDTSDFPFIQAELCLQFHDDSIAKYPATYHSLAQDLEANGRLKPSRCPANYICNSTTRADFGMLV
jgi:peptide methionine sulfoxide reductase MsrA